MNRYIVRINPVYKETLKQYGNILFDSKLIDGLMGIESELSLEEMNNIPHVTMVENDREGTFN